MESSFSGNRKASVPLPLLPMKNRHLALIGFRWQGKLYYLGLQGAEKGFIRNAIKPLILAEALQLKPDWRGKPGAKRGLETKAGLTLKMKC